MDSQHVQEIEGHAMLRGWSIVTCPRCQGRPDNRRRDCCDGLRRVLTFPNALGEISFRQYEEMHIVQGLVKPPSSPAEEVEIPRRLLREGTT
jgi:hypothetical protein